LEEEMAVFLYEPPTWERIDWQLMQNGPVSLYWRETYLDEDLRWLKEHGYRVETFDASAWTTEVQMHADFARTLAFADYYGSNLDALNDCLSDLEIPYEGGLVVVLRHFDAFTRRFTRVAWTVLDILANRSRTFMLCGLRFIAVAQSDDATLNLSPVGATAVNWNRREWLNRDRGL
jgi:RNAse (barnase) inhibitor barstar